LVWVFFIFLFFYFLFFYVLFSLFTSGHIKSSPVVYCGRLVFVCAYYLFASVLSAKLWIHSPCYSSFHYTCMSGPHIFRSLWFVVINGQFFMTVFNIVSYIFIKSYNVTWLWCSQTKVDLNKILLQDQSAN
jgi:hypothetical protein